MACPDQLSGDRDRRDRGGKRLVPNISAFLSKNNSNEGSQEEFAPMSDHAPVTDWVHDFDHTDPRWTENPFPIWDELRAECPVVHTKRFLGCYMPTPYEAVKQVAYDTEHFSSRRV